MTKRESNAERLARILGVCDKERLDGDDYALRELIEAVHHPLREEDFAVRRAGRILDILASWRTCKGCVEWTRYSDDEKDSEFGFCGRSGTGLPSPESPHEDWGCIDHEERTE